MEDNPELGDTKSYIEVFDGITKATLNSLQLRSTVYDIDICTVKANASRVARSRLCHLQLPGPDKYVRLTVLSSTVSR